MADDRNAGRKTVLVVDDDPDFREQMRAPLEAAGFAVETAGGEGEAEAVLARRLPDLAVVDLMMERLDSGLTLCYRLKRRCPTLPVVLVTAVASETGLEFDATGDDERAWLKADACLAKPVRPERLTQVINQLLKG
jgi:CheY-like chemotaxis protein